MSQNKEFIKTLPSRLDLTHAGAKGNLEKGHLSEAFSYSDLKTAFTIKKAGKDISGAMDKTIAFEESIIASCKAKAEAYKVEGVEPTGNPSSYMSNGYGGHQSFGEIPKVYSYEQKYPEDSYSEVKEAPVSTTMTMSGSMVSPAQKQGLSASVKKSMQNYNNCIHKIIECMVEIKIAKTVKNGVDENKSYELTVKQAAALGF